MVKLLSNRVRRMSKKNHTRKFKVNHYTRKSGTMTRKMRRAIAKFKLERRNAVPLSKEFFIMGHSDHFKDRGVLHLPKGVELGHVICEGKKLRAEMVVEDGELFIPLLDSVARHYVHTDNPITKEMVISTSPSTIKTDGIYLLHEDKIIQILHFDDVEDKRTLSELADIVQKFSTANGYGENVMLKVITCRRENLQQLTAVWVVGNKSLKKSIKGEGIVTHNSLSFSEFVEIERQMNLKNDDEETVLWSNEERESFNNEETPPFNNEDRESFNNESPSQRTLNTM